MLILFAEPIVVIFYGEGFKNIAPLVQVLSIYMIFIMWRNPMGTITIASGRTDLEFYWTSFTFLFLPIAVYIGAQFNIVTVAASMTLVMAILFVPLWMFVIRKIIDVELLAYTKAHIPNYQWVSEFIKNRK